MNAVVPVTAPMLAVADPAVSVMQVERQGVTYRVRLLNVTNRCEQDALEAMTYVVECAQDMRPADMAATIDARLRYCGVKAEPCHWVRESQR